MTRLSRRKGHTEKSWYLSCLVCRLIYFHVSKADASWVIGCWYVFHPFARVNICKQTHWCVFLKPLLSEASRCEMWLSTSAFTTDISHRFCVCFSLSVVLIKKLVGSLLDGLGRGVCLIHSWAHPWECFYSSPQCASSIIKGINHCDLMPCYDTALLPLRS